MCEYVRVFMKKICIWTLNILTCDIIIMCKLISVNMCPCFLGAGHICQHVCVNYKLCAVSAQFSITCFFIEQFSNENEPQNCASSFKLSETADMTA